MTLVGNASTALAGHGGHGGGNAGGGHGGATGGGHGGGAHVGVMPGGHWGHPGFGHGPIHHGYYGGGYYGYPFGVGLGIGLGYGGFGYGGFGLGYGYYGGYGAYSGGYPYGFGYSTTPYYGIPYGYGAGDLYYNYPAYPGYCPPAPAVPGTLPPVSPSLDLSVNGAPVMPPSTAATTLTMLVDPASHRTSDNDVTLIVHTPPEAIVWINDLKTSQAGPYREFVSAGSAPGRIYTFHVRAQWTTPDGSSIVISRTASLVAGEKRTIDFRTIGTNTK